MSEEGFAGHTIVVPIRVPTFEERMRHEEFPQLKAMHLARDALLEGFIRKLRARATAESKED